MYNGPIGVLRRKIRVFELRWRRRGYNMRAQNLLFGISFMFSRKFSLAIFPYTYKYIICKPYIVLRPCLLLAFRCVKCTHIIYVTVNVRYIIQALLCIIQFVYIRWLCLRLWWADAIPRWSGFNVEKETLYLYVCVYNILRICERMSMRNNAKSEMFPFSVGSV